MKTPSDLSKENRFESARTEVSIISNTSPLSISLLPNSDEGEQLRRQKSALLTQWEETRCKVYADHNTVKFRTVLETVCDRLAAKTEISREVNIACVRFLREKLKSDLMLATAMKKDLVFLPETPAVDVPFKSALCEVRRHQGMVAEKVHALANGEEQ